MDNTLQTRAKAAIAAMSADTEASYLTAWRRVDSFIRDHAPKGAKVFEVHHSIEAARERFFVAMIDGKPADECEKAALAPVQSTPLRSAEPPKRKPTIYEALRDKLGREPTGAELKADMQRISDESLQERAAAGKLRHQRRRR